MKALEFASTLGSQRTLDVPADVAHEIPVGQPLRVILLIPDDEGDRDWEHLAASEFGQGYCDSDSIYDQVPNR